MPSPARRPEGFLGEHLVVLPQPLIWKMENHSLLQGLFPAAAGYFPKAGGHYVERKTGVPEVIVIACLSGEGWLRLKDDPQVAITAGDVVILPSQLPHIYGADKTKPWSIMWFHCQGADMEKYLHLLKVTPKSPIIHLPPGTLERIDFGELYTQLEQGYTLAHLLVSSARLRLILAEIIRHRLPASSRARSSEEALVQSMEWMRLHCHAPASLNGLAQQAGLSVPHYSSLFRRKTGFSPISYFLRLKIQRASQLLDTTKLSVEAVAQDVGMDDPYYFSRLFKKIMGQSPRAFRKIQKG